MKFSVIFWPFFISVSLIIVSIFDFFNPVILKSDRVGNSIISKDYMYYFFGIGFLSSFTTMSAFSYQTIELFNTNILIACSYIILTLALTILATYIGINFSK